MAEQKTYSIKIDGINESIQGVESLGDNVAKTGDAWKDTQKALKAVKAEMAGLDKSSDEWKQLAKVAGDYKDKLDDINQAARRFASDTKGIDDAINIGQSITSVYTLAEGAMSAFGVSTEDAVAAIQKMQGAMSILQSLKTLQDTLRGSTATSEMFTKAMNLMSVALGKGSTASKVLRGAMLAIPLMIIITLVTELVLHWDELVGWFTKTFPALKNLTTWFNKVKGAVAGVSNAVWATIKSFSNLGSVVKELLSGHWGKAVEIVKNSLNNISNAYQKSYADKLAEIEEGVTLKQVEENNKRTKHKLDMLKAQKGNAAKYSKEGIALQKKDFAERKKLAKGNQEELNKIAVEEASFYRECQESKSAAAKKAASDAKKAAKETADAEKKAAEEAKKAREKHRNAEGAYYKSIKELEIQRLEQDKENAKKEVDKYATGSVEKYTEAVDKLKKSVIKLKQAQNGLAFYDIFKEYEDNFMRLQDQTANVVTRMEDFKGVLKLFNNEMVNLGENTLENFTKASKKINGFTNLTEDEIMTFYHLYLDAIKTGESKTEEVVADVQGVLLSVLKKAEDDIEYVTLQYELQEDKKSEASKELVGQLKMVWDNYLEYVKNVYGEDSKEYLEAQKKKRQATQKTIDNASPVNKKKSKTKKDDVNGGFGVSDQTNWSSLWDEDSPVFENLMNLDDLLFENVLDPIGDAFSTLLEFQIEEAQAALDEATEMHDASVEKVQESQSKIEELNEKMKNSSGAQLEAYKQQQADEMLLMAQREAEEKRLQREKEKREKELERKQKQQKKLDLKMTLATSLANTAEGVTKALTWGFPLGTIFAAIIGAMGAIQIATITKQISKLADGGLLFGNSHSMGGIPVGNTGVEVEGGEYVVNKRSTKKYLPLLQQINEEGAMHKTRANQIGKFADGGQLNYQRIAQNLDSVNQTKLIQTAIGDIDFHPVVSVVDINRGQKNYAEVRQLSGARN